MFTLFKLLLNTSVSATSWSTKKLTNLSNVTNYQKSNKFLLSANRPPNGS
jgi:hypothetical protein